MENMPRAQMGYECKNWDWFFSSSVVHPVVELKSAKLSSHFFLQILKINSDKTIFTYLFCIAKRISKKARAREILDRTKF